MADRMAASIEIGGRLKKDLLHEFIILVSEYGTDDGSASADEKYVLDAIKKNRPLDRPLLEGRPSPPV